jgi:DNA-binding XRE family transcriptional regulator/desulfoferrodoxin (superoxide reductase-like protein)
MDHYVTGSTIKALREANGYTQKQLADLVCVSDKAVSRWETGRGLPDISLLEPLSAALGVSLSELLAGAPVHNSNRSGNPARARFYLCPVCGNLIWAMGSGSYSCCGVTLPPLEAEEPDEEHALHLEAVEDEWYVTLRHPMDKDHFISFLAWVSFDRVQIVKLYPQQEAAARLPRRGGQLYACCSRHGLFRLSVPRK